MYQHSNKKILYSLERLTAYTSCSKAAVLYEFIGVNNIESHNTIKNVQGNTLDLVLSTYPRIIVERVDSLVQSEDPTHPPLLITLLHH